MLVNEDILRLEIPVDQLEVVQVLERQDNLTCVKSRMTFTIKQDK